MADDNAGQAIDIGKAFVLLVIQSPPALVTLGVSTFFGYGISFILFDYRRSQIQKSHYMFHVSIGLGYAAAMFCLVNFDLVTRTLTVEQITTRIPLTLLLSLGLAFVIMLVGAIWRELSAPYTAGQKNGNDN
ncbi:MAG TPA: hypothetical protein VGG64_21025 [Pirellulales bacterium]|jgi:hypothetical protein